MPGQGVPIEDFVQRTFSYLVVGGGTAGLCVAARLSEDPNVTVGVLEAGDSHVQQPSIDVPGRYGESIGGPFDWKYETTPQPGLAGRRLPWPRGRIVGGTSALNFMTWNRPNREVCLLCQLHLTRMLTFLLPFAGPGRLGGAR
jgi:choline dehydrogenase-like flavoprotein